MEGPSASLGPFRMTEKAMPAKIIVRDLVKRYDATEALRQVSFEVPAGTIFGLLGPNGAGKTTLLECLLGLRTPDGGAVHFDGVDALAEPEHAKRHVGAALQSTALQDRITPREALDLFGTFYPEPVLSAELLRRFGLTDKANMPFDSLSGGQRQRLALALACVHQPDILCLDEPTNGLDPQARRELHGLIRRLREEGRTILLATHYVEEAHALCDQVAVLHEGRLVTVGPPSDLLARHRRNPHLVLRTTGEPNPEDLLALPEVQRVQRAAGEIWLEVEHVGRAIVAVVHWLEARDLELLDLRVSQPLLEDMVIELTDTRPSP